MDSNEAKASANHACIMQTYILQYATRGVRGWAAAAIQGLTLQGLTSQAPDALMSHLDASPACSRSAPAISCLLDSFPLHRDPVEDAPGFSKAASKAGSKAAASACASLHCQGVIKLTKCRLSST